MKIDVKVEFNLVKIYFNDVLFLFIKRDEFIGMYASNEGGDRYYIKFHTKTTVVLTEFDQKEKWVMILKEIDKWSVEF